MGGRCVELLHYAARQFVSAFPSRVTAPMLISFSHSPASPMPAPADMNWAVVVYL